MALDNKKCIFVYGFDESEILRLEEIAKKEKLPQCRIIDKSMGSMTLKDITEGLRFEVQNISLPPERLFLFNNLNDTELETAIHIVRSNFGSEPMLAVITESSIKWSFEYLLNHLVEEREWFKKNKR